MQAVAQAAGAALEFVAVGEAIARVTAAPPDRVILDLHAPGITGVARVLKSDPATARIPLVGFYSHVEANLRRDAREAGVDEVMPRSAFVKKLPALLGVPEPPKA
jgi:CheY-like chemotaxis protein